MLDKYRNAIFIDYEIVRQGLAEFLGTLVLIVIGDGSIAQCILSEQRYGTFLSINLAYGLAVSLAVYISAGVSGGHVNPAVSLAMCCLGQLRWHKLPVYMIAQYLGAFFGSGFVYTLYCDALNDFHRNNPDAKNLTMQIFATYPQTFLSIEGALYDQIFGTFLLTLCVTAITDKRNCNVPGFLSPLLIGLLVMAIGMSFGYNCGYAINPARDFGPRAFSALINDWGLSVFYNSNKKKIRYFFWIPIVGPHIGAIVGAFTYFVVISAHWPKIEADAAATTKHSCYCNSCRNDINENDQLLDVVELTRLTSTAAAPQKASATEAATTTATTLIVIPYQRHYHHHDFISMQCALGLLLTSFLYDIVQQQQLQ